MNNYEIMRNQMRGEFVKYEQEKMIKKFSLESNENYIYIMFLLRKYRIDRKSGLVEWSADGFLTTFEADYNESMTIYDVLCYSKEDCRLSGNYCPVNRLNGIVQSSNPGSNMFQGAADGFNGKLEELKRVCGFLGDKLELSGDLAVKLYPFTFLPVIMQYWEADEEFPANLKFMFDENILDYMHYETIFFMTGHIIKRIQDLMETNSITC